MQYWLVKSEPDDYSWDDLVQEAVGVWDGVRNYQARNNLNQMRKGDQVLFYHSGKSKTIVGIAAVVRTAYQDPTTTDSRWISVDLMPVQPLQNPVSLEAVKSDPELFESTLVKQSRLSVMPIEASAFARIISKSEEESHGQ